jgi:hypothetical protein
VYENSLSTSAIGVRVYSTSNLTLHHNRFVGSTLQAEDEGGPENAWDDGYPSGGNYWSDYIGPDVCSGPAQDVCPDPDGIGDAPYVIDSDSEDRYPLMLPFPDTLPPAVTIDAPLDGTQVTEGNVTVSGTAVDTGGSGLNRVEVRVNGGGWSTATGTSAWSVTIPLDPGVALIEARAWDRAGHVSPLDSVNVTYDPDTNTPPVPTVTSTPTSRSTPSGPPTRRT